MTTLPDVRTTLKRLRVSQPFNVIATSLVRAACRPLQHPPDVVVRHLHRAGTVRFALTNGRRMALWSRGDDGIANQVFWRGWMSYEPETTPLFFRLAAQARVTVDVGAHVGFYSLLAAHANPEGSVFAFEPHPLVHERLCRNVRLNEVGNVTCVMSAVGVEDSEATLYDGGAETLPSGSTLCPTAADEALGLRAYRVAVVNLDAWLQRERVKDVDLVKIDTERAEPAVLAGMRDTLARDRPAIVCEVLEGGGTESALEQILRPLDYRYLLLSADGPRPVTTIRGDRRWLNYLFVPAGRRSAWTEIEATAAAPSAEGVRR